MQVDMHWSITGTMQETRMDKEEDQASVALAKPKELLNQNV
jgi:hypothetical protein